MSTERESGYVWIMCDSCGETSSQVRNAEFQDLVEQIKQDDWTVTRRDGTWHHYCQNCDPEMSRLEQAKRKFGLR